MARSVVEIEAATGQSWLEDSATSEMFVRRVEKIVRSRQGTALRRAGAVQPFSPNEIAQEFAKFLSRLPAVPGHQPQDRRQNDAETCPPLLEAPAQVEALLRASAAFQAFVEQSSELLRHREVTSSGEHPSTPESGGRQSAAAKKEKLK